MSKKYVLALCDKEKTFLYSHRSLHYVTKASAEIIKTTLNKRGYCIFNNNTVWEIFPAEDFNQADILRRFSLYHYKGGTVIKDIDLDLIPAFY